MNEQTAERMSKMRPNSSKRAENAPIFYEIDRLMEEIDEGFKIGEGAWAAEQASRVLFSLRRMAEDPAIGGISLEMVLSRAARERRKESKQWKSWGEEG